MRLFVGSLGFWLLLSGRLDALTLGLGVVASALVARANRRDDAAASLLRALPRLAAYAPWLLGEIVRANLHVARLVLHPRLPIDPVVVRVPAPFRTDLARTVFGNSITLTPGTVTVEVEGEELVVHALTRQAADALLDGAMARRVARALEAPAG